jgi:glycerol-3-phosphate dehydrogenase (NAD(P)+)
MKIVILGAGTWGIAMSRMLSNEGYDVSVWSALESEIDILNETRVYEKLDNLKLPESIIFTKDMAKACENADFAVFAVPSVFIRDTAKKAADLLSRDCIIVNLAKGIEDNSFYLMTEVISDAMQLDDERKDKIVALSGPTHAEEVAKDLPTTIVSSCKDIKTAQKVQSVFSTDFMRVYTNTDIKGVELCGALKNVMALAAGMSDGLGFGDNAKAAIITRGLVEIQRLGVAMGCDANTFSGLAGIGDIVVTATSVHSRNHRAGELLGKGYNLEDTLKEVGMVVEGINALVAAKELMKKHHVEMPIIDSVYDVVYGHKPANEILPTLFGRKPKHESQ